MSKHWNRYTPTYNSGTSRLVAHLGGEYNFQRVDDKSADQTLTMDSHEFMAHAEFTLRLSALWSAGIGAHYLDISSEQRLRGTTRATHAQDSHEHYYSSARLELNAGGDGAIGVTVHKGALDGYALYFQRRY